MKKPIIPEQFAHYYKDWHFAPAVEVEKFVFFAGTTATRPDGTIASEPRQQFVEVFEKAAVYLNEAGLTFADVVEMTTYHVGLREHWDDFVAVKDEFVIEPYPAWSAIGVAELITEGALVEIRMIAYRG